MSDTLKKVIRDKRTSIVPGVPTYYDLPEPSTLDYKAICCFVATGFFLEDDTYFTNRKAFLPGRQYRFDEHGNVLECLRHFQWHYSPRQLSFNQALEEFSHLLESIVEKETIAKKVILPISGGLDSRTLAAALKDHPDVYAYSYEFEGGIPENSYGRKVARAAGFSHDSFKIPNGYLWSIIDTLALLNHCYAEFINPRQMAIWQQTKYKGNLYLLGHGGDLFFDGMGVEDNLSEEDQLDYLKKKLIRPVGLELGATLWQVWGLEGNFKDYIFARFEKMLSELPINNANTRLRAFKTEYYVGRWTATNLELFQQQQNISLPFFDDEMCKFICTISESHLASRKLEIEYLKRSAPAMASIPWQKYYPCNLYDYERFNTFPVKVQRAFIKGNRLVKEAFGKRGDTRNWELQFLGEDNDRQLKYYLNASSVDGLIPKSVLDTYYQYFKHSPKEHWFTITMLLTLSLFSKHFLKKD
ncbi:MAG: asparagine synthase-related protein [Cyclobacteriaceae bacterium]